MGEGWRCQEVQVVRGTYERLALRPGTDCTVTGPLPLLPTVPPLPPPTPTSSTLLLSPQATGSGCSSQQAPIHHNQADKMTSPQTLSPRYSNLCLFSGLSFKLVAKTKVQKYIRNSSYYDHSPCFSK